VAASSLSPRKRARDFPNLKEWRLGPPVVLLVAIPLRICKPVEAALDGVLLKTSVVDTVGHYVLESGGRSLSHRTIMSAQVAHANQSA
jgi:hypothetical protein